jgi:hypothetical protein
MKTTSKDSESVHIGYNARRIREIAGKKQILYLTLYLKA